jgi:hypothetical protein
VRGIDDRPGVKRCGCDLVRIGMSIGPVYDAELRPQSVDCNAGHVGAVSYAIEQDDLLLRYGLGRLSEG